VFFLSRVFYILVYILVIKMQSRHALKLYESPDDSRDYIIKAVDVVEPVGYCDLSVHCTGVKNQGLLSSSTAFAAIAALEYLHKRFSVSQDEEEKLFSERFTYYATRVNILKWVPDDSGAYIRDTIKSLVKYGSCLSKTFTYNSDCRISPSTSAYKEAAGYQVLSYAKFDSGTKSTDDKQNLLNVLKVTMDSGLPIITGFKCYSNIQNAVNGVIPKQNGQLIGGHAVLLVGYNDETRLFKFKNSWGASWGDNGYGYLSYDYYLAGDMFDMWAIQQAEIDDSKIAGINWIDPKKEESDERKKVKAALTDVIDHLNVILDKDLCLSELNKLLMRHKDDRDVYNLLNAMKGGLYKLSR
jgi:hypothetical protein